MDYATPSYDTALRGLAHQLAALSAWIDEANAHRDPEAITWGRIAKVTKEQGEAIAAFIAATGQNPRKGITGSAEDVIRELLDVAVSALGTVEHFLGNTGASVPRLARHVDQVCARAGIDATNPPARPRERSDA